MSHLVRHPRSLLVLPIHLVRIQQLVLLEQPHSSIDCYQLVIVRKIDIRTPIEWERLPIAVQSPVCLRMTLLFCRRAKSSLTYPTPWTRPSGWPYPLL